jgi:TolA-binding protein
MTILRERHIALGLILCAAICVIANAYTSKSSSESEGMTGSQDVRTLDRRVSFLEQRLYSIESSINRLEQSTRAQRPPVSQSSGQDQQIGLLRGEVITLQSRVAEIECGLVKLDERTTAPAVREARRGAGAKTSDPCRLNAATPLRLSTRP